MLYRGILRNPLSISRHACSHTMLHNLVVACLNSLIGGSFKKAHKFSVHSLSRHKKLQAWLASQILRLITITQGPIPGV
jgi:hypothetical protein